MPNTYNWLSAPNGGFWSDPTNWQNSATDQTPAGPPVAGDTALIQGATGFAIQIVSGPGQAGTLTIVGNNALEQNFTLGLASIGTSSTLEPSPIYTNNQPIDLEPHSTLSASVSTTILNPFEADGGVLTTAGTLYAGGSDALPAIVIVNFGVLQANQGTLDGGTLLIDSNSASEIGAAGDAVAGALTIDQGATLDTGDNETYNAVIVDDGLILATGTSTFNDSITGIGTGTLALAAISLLTVFEQTDISNLGSIQLGSGSTLNVAGSLLNDGPVTNDGTLSVANDVTGSSIITVGTNGSLEIGGTLSGLSAVFMGYNSELRLTGQDTNVPISLDGVVGIVLTHGSDIGGAVSSFDSSDLIRSIQSDTDTYVVTDATWSSGTLTLSSGTLPLSTIAMSGNYTGQQFLTNSVGIPYGDTDIVLPNAFVTNIAPGDQTIIGSAVRAFTLLTGTDNAGNLTFTGNTALEGTYTATSLQIIKSATTTDDALDLQANTSLTVTGTTNVQANLELDRAGSSMTIDDGLLIGGDANYEGQVLLINGASLQVTSGGLEIEGVTNVSAISVQAPTSLSLVARQWNSAPSAVSPPALSRSMPATPSPARWKTVPSPSPPLSITGSSPRSHRLRICPSSPSREPSPEAAHSRLSATSTSTATSPISPPLTSAPAPT